MQDEDIYIVSMIHRSVGVDDNILINEMNGSEKHLLTVKRGDNVCDRCVPCKKLTKYRAVYKLKLISFKQGTVLCIRST